MKRLFPWKRDRKQAPIERYMPGVADGLCLPKVWGTEILLTVRPTYTAKKLVVKPGYTCSRHWHPKKAESFHVLSGRGLIEVDGHLRVAPVGTLIHVPAGTPHRFMVLPQETGPMVILEVSSHHDDRDVVRESPSGILNGQPELLAACENVDGFRHLQWAKVLW